jgi:hypothetical protein
MRSGSNFANNYGAGGGGVGVRSSAFLLVCKCEPRHDTVSSHDHVRLFQLRLLTQLKYENLFCISILVNYGEYRVQSVLRFVVWDEPRCCASEIDFAEFTVFRFPLRASWIGYL